MNNMNGKNSTVKVTARTFPQSTNGELQQPYNVRPPYIPSKVQKTNTNLKLYKKATKI